MAEPQLAVYPALTESVPRCTAIDPSQLPALPNLLRIGPPTCGATLAYTGMSPTLGAPTTQRRQTTLRFEGRLGLSGLPPPEFGSPTGGLPPLATLPRVASPLPAGAQAAQASSTKKRKAPAALVNGARPVAASLSLGYSRTVREGVEE